MSRGDQGRKTIFEAYSRQHNPLFCHFCWEKSEKELQVGGGCWFAEQLDPLLLVVSSPDVKKNLNDKNKSNKRDS
jgi:hypothetical protein